MLASPYSHASGMVSAAMRVKAARLDGSPLSTETRPTIGTVTHRERSYNVQETDAPRHNCITSARMGCDGREPYRQADVGGSFVAASHKVDASHIDGSQVPATSSDVVGRTSNSDQDSEMKGKLS